MEINQTPIRGYYLVITESGGKYDFYFEQEVKSYFIAKNSKTYMTILGILKEFQFKRRDDHYVPNVDLVAELMDSNSFHAPPKSVGDRAWNNPDDMYISLYEAVRVGDEVFKKVEIFERFRAEEIKRFRRR